MQPRPTRKSEVSSLSSVTMFSRARPNDGQTVLEGNRRWQSNGDYFWSANLTLDTLPAGLYRASYLDGVGNVWEKMSVKVDDLIDFPNSPSADVITEIRQFWKLAPEFEKRGFLHKRGVLLWGAPGSGKTSTLQQLISIVIHEHDGLAIFLSNPNQAVHVLQTARRIEPERPIVGILEDIDALVETYSESEYLALLDGETQVSNIVFVATTNYPKKLDPRFIDRPSRFDLIREIGMPVPLARRLYFKTKEPSLTDDELKEWVRHTEGFSFAYLRELIVLCRCYGKTLDAALIRMNQMRDQLSTSMKTDDGRSAASIGFTSSKNDSPAEDDNVSFDF